VAALIAVAVVSTVKNESRDKRHFPHGGLDGGCCDFGPPFSYIGFRPPLPYVGFRPPSPWEVDILDVIED